MAVNDVDIAGCSRLPCAFVSTLPPLDVRPSCSSYASSSPLRRPRTRSVSSALHYHYQHRHHLLRRPTPAYAVLSTTSESQPPYQSSSSSSSSSASSSPLPSSTPSSSAAAVPSPTPPAAVDDPTPGYQVHDWTFKSFRVRYATARASGQWARDGPAVVLVHGFGANCEHWRNNLLPLCERGFRVYAMDLLGFGLGDKPRPGTKDSNGDLVQYTFDYWTLQLRQFLDEVVHGDDESTKEKEGVTNGTNGTTISNGSDDTVDTMIRRPVFLVANSIGCMVTMQYAIQWPMDVKALTFISPSLRQLNVRKRSWVQDITAPLLMRVLAYRPIGAFFLDSLSKPDALRRVLNTAYAVNAAVDDDLIRILREPARTDGALDVFLSFISYDTGPIPEDFLPDLTQPALVLWGEDDQFEPFELGQKLKHYSVVEKFVALPRTGHCAHDERPDKCNELIGDFLERHRGNGNGNGSGSNE